MVESALMFGELPGAHSLQVDFGAPARRRGRLIVPVTLTIPMDDVVMLPASGRSAAGFEANLELRIAALDAGSHRNEIAVVPVWLHGDRPPRPGEHAVYETAVKLRRQCHDLVVSLHDPVGGTIFASGSPTRGLSSPGERAWASCGRDRLDPPTRKGGPGPPDERLPAGPPPPILQGADPLPPGMLERQAG